jgi:hypothetical protein
MGAAFPAVSAWGAVPLVLLVLLFAFQLPGPGPLTTTMEHRGGRDHDDGALPWLRMWLGPFAMASINTRVVRRSNARRGSP